MENNISKLGIALLLSTLVISFIGCQKDTNCCTIIDTDVQLAYKNQAGENLINSHPDFSADNIKIYYKNGGTFEEAYQANLDTPKMYRIDEDQAGNLILTIFPSNNYTSNQSTTLIALNPTVVDTLVCEFELSNNKEVCTNAWLNGIEMSNRFIEIIK